MTDVNLESQIRPTILVAEDDRVARRLYRHILEKEGYEVFVAPDGEVAMAALEGEQRFDAVLCDINLPGLDGVAILKHAHDADLGIPIILMTAGPRLETALKSVEYKAFQYLTKPFPHDALIATMAQAIIHARKESDRQQGRRDLNRDLDASAATMTWQFQAIAKAGVGELVGFEALATPRAEVLLSRRDVLEAARALNRTNEIGQTLRDRVVRRFDVASHGSRLQMNLHPMELLDDALYDADAPLSRIANRVTLELTDAATLSGVPDLSGRLERLRKLGFRIALDDFGVGGANLTLLADIKPDMIKLSAELIEGIVEDSTRRVIVQTIVQLANQLNIDVVAMGIESSEIHDAVRKCGCQLLQGGWVARPREFKRDVSEVAPSNVRGSRSQRLRGI